MARSCTILGAKPGSLNLTLRATGSQGSFQAEEGGGMAFFKNSFWLQSGDRRLGRAEGKSEEMVTGTRVREKGVH